MAGAQDQETVVQVTLARMTDMAAQGWYSGSTHVHMNYGGNLHNSLENLMFMSAAEDQDIVNELIANKDNRILDYQYFVPGGGPHPLSTAEPPEFCPCVGQDHQPATTHLYGHVFMLAHYETNLAIPCPYTHGLLWAQVSRVSIPAIAICSARTGPRVQRWVMSMPSLVELPSEGV